MVTKSIVKALSAAVVMSGLAMPGSGVAQQQGMGGMSGKSGMGGMSGMSGMSRRL